MGRKRTNKNNRGLPSRWRYQHGAYYYDVPKKDREQFDGKSLFRLGSTLSESYLKFAEYCESGPIKTFKDLLDRYMIEVVPFKSHASQRSNSVSKTYIEAVFAKSKPSLIKPIHIYQYRDVRSQDGKHACNRDLEMLSHIFTKAIEWGVIEEHPMKGKVLKNTVKARDRLITASEFDVFYNEYAGEFLQLYILLKLIMPLRKSDILRIKLSDLKEDGVHAYNSKASRLVIFEWSNHLRTITDQIKAARKKITGLYLFCNRMGRPYVNDEGLTSGFDSIWQRRMNKFEAAGNQRFNEHDIRALASSESESDEIARKLLDHSQVSVTRKHYRRAVSRITPHNSSKLEGKI